MTQSPLSTAPSSPTPAPVIMQMFSTAHAVSSVVPARTYQTVFLHLLSELGELAEECLIHSGDLNKPAGPDGVVGEVADSLNCLMDMVWLRCEGTPRTSGLDHACTTIAQEAKIPSLDTLEPMVFSIALEIFTQHCAHLYRLQSTGISPRSAITDGDAMAFAGLIRILLLLAKAADPTLTDAAFLERYATKCEKWRRKSTQA